MRGDGNCGGAVNDEANNFAGPVEVGSVGEPPLGLSGDADCYDRRDDNDDHTEAGGLFRSMSAERKKFCSRTWSGP